MEKGSSERDSTGPHGMRPFSLKRHKERRDHYLAALRAGAFDYSACPPDFAETERIVWSAIGHTREFSSATAH